MPDLPLSQHAALRTQLRSRHSDVALVLDRADAAIPAGRDREAIFISRKALARLQKLAILSAQDVERLADLYLVLGPDGGIITVIKTDTFRPYRPGPKGNWGHRRTVH